MSRYPSAVELEQIRKWQGTPKELIEFIHSIWAYRQGDDWEIKETREFGRRVWRVRFSTLGWSGNEEIVSELDGSWFMFFFKWSWRRGGHYELHIEKSMMNSKPPTNVANGWGAMRDE